VRTHPLDFTLTAPPPKRLAVLECHASSICSKGFFQRETLEISGEIRLCARRNQSKGQERPILKARKKKVESTPSNKPSRNSVARRKYPSNGGSESHQGSNGADILRTYLIYPAWSSGGIHHRRSHGRVACVPWAQAAQAPS
jgi:hypothetical protein